MFVTKMTLIVDGMLVRHFVPCTLYYDPDCRRYAGTTLCTWGYVTIALCNLANSPQTQVEVFVHGGLAPITAINKLAANEGNHTVIFGKDVVKRVIQLAQSLFFNQQGNNQYCVILLYIQFLTTLLSYI